MKRSLSIALLATLVLAGSAFAGDHHDKKDSHHGKAHWGYEGNSGPDKWGSMDKKFGMCDSGMRQSPIDIGMAPHAEFKALAMNYKPAPLRVLNNGHAIQMNYDKSSTMTVDGKRYNLLQFHFHSPSENIKDGQSRAMEMHLVHQANDGSLAVVGVFLKAGNDNAALAKLWSHLPSHAGDENMVKGASFNVSDLLPSKKAYYHFNGSLTTPPCSEGVKWFVMDEEVEVSKKQVNQFLKVVGENARPVQPMNGRFLLHRM